MWYRHKYGILLQQPIDARAVEMIAARTGRTVAEGGLGRTQHYLNYAKMVFPKLELNEWLLRQIESLTSDEYAYKDGNVTIRAVSWTGAGAAGKTFCAGLMALLFFSLLPKKSAVTLVSTSKIMLRRRVYPVIQSFYQDMSKTDFAFGHCIDSQMMIQSEKGNSKNAIAGVAVQAGEIHAAIEALKGLHCDRIMVVIDEASSVPQAIFETIPNIRLSCKELIILVIANALSHVDPHGRCCEPLDGWSSINLDSDIWKTKGVPEWRIPPGVCHRFDGHRSPNVKAGRTVVPYLFSWEDYKQSLKNAEGRQTIQMWSQDRGFWAPIGILNTVMDENMIARYDGTGSHRWQTFSENIASLDPAFGGDNCRLQFGKYGDLPNTRFGVQLVSAVNIQADPSSKETVDHQIAHRVIMECDKRGIRPENFAMDKTGTGRGIYAILVTEWGQVLGVEFGGAPSTKMASSTDSRSSVDVYDRRVSELWFSCREFLLTEQLKGLYPECIVEFCSREYEIKNRKICLSTKDECRKAIGRSPDAGDAIAVLIELARTKGAVAGTYQKQSDRWEKVAKEFDSIYDDDITANDAIEEMQVLE